MLIQLEKHKLLDFTFTNLIVLIYDELLFIFNLIALTKAVIYVK